MTTTLRKSKSLELAEKIEGGSVSASRVGESLIRSVITHLQIKPIQCFGKWIVVLRLPEVQSGTILTASSSDPGCQGVIVGCSEKSDQFAVGDKVFFLNRNKIAEFPLTDPIYKNRELIPMTEDNVVCKLPLNGLTITIAQ